MTEVTLIFHLTLKKLPENIKRGYIFTYSENDASITAFLEGKSIVFGIPRLNNLGIPQSNKLVDFIKVPVELEKRIAISFCYYQTNDCPTLAIYFGQEKVAEKIIQNNHKIEGFSRLLYCIGCSILKKNFGYLDLYEMMAYTRLLDKAELSQIINYINENGVKGYVAFRGKQFMFSDLNNGNFVQPNPEYQPKYEVIEI